MCKKFDDTEFMIERRKLRRYDRDAIVNILERMPDRSHEDIVNAYESLNGRKACTVGFYCSLFEKDILNELCAEKV